MIETMLAAGKPVAAVCHAPGVLRHAKTADGKPLVQGRQVTGFSNTEEAAVQLTAVVPFLVEAELALLGGLYSKGPAWQPHIVSDGLQMCIRDRVCTARSASATWRKPSSTVCR